MVSKGTTKVKEDDDGEEAKGSREKYVIGDLFGRFVFIWEVFI